MELYWITKDDDFFVDDFDTDLVLSGCNYFQPHPQNFEGTMSTEGLQDKQKPDA